MSKNFTRTLLLFIVLLSTSLCLGQTSSTTSTGNMITGRTYHTATLLPNGKVLVAGGSSDAGVLSSAELYDPTTGKWTATGSMSTDRYLHTATLLPNGKVLVAGGSSDAALLSSAELYDPSTGKWSATGSMSTDRYLHTATLLQNGKVLVSGGDPGGSPSSELYDPSTGTWMYTGNNIVGRSDHTATLLPNGKVLVAGGSVSYDEPYYFSSELYDPSTGTWSATGNLTAGRYNATATLLPNGKVLVAGGYNQRDDISLLSSELYDPLTGIWDATGDMSSARTYFTATLMLDGKVLVSGGYDYRPDDGIFGYYLSSSELYDPITGAWTSAENMSFDREDHTATLLQNGKVLIAGGDGVYTGISSSSELYGGISGNPIICTNATTQLSVTETNGAWNSSMPSVATIDKNGLVTGIIAGTTTISYTFINDLGVSTTYTLFVTVNALPSATIAADGPTTICSGSVTLTAPEGDSYLWSNGDTTRSITISNENSADYYTVTTSSKGCSASSDPLFVEIDALPELPSVHLPANICIGTPNASVYRGGNDPGGEWTSSDPSIVSVTVRERTRGGNVQGPPTGDYIVTLQGIATGTAVITFSNSNGECSASQSFTVTVNDPPQATITTSGNTSICPGGSVILHANEGTSYYWSNGETTQDITVTQAGDYTVEVTNEAGCAVTSLPVSVVVNEITEAAPIYGSTDLCTGTTVQLGNENGGGVWSSGDNAIATIDANGVVTGISAGSVLITYTGACGITSSVTVTVNAPVTPTFTQVGPVFYGTAIDALPATSNNGITGTWSPALDNTVTTTYTFTPDEGQCAATATMTIVMVHDIEPPVIACHENIIQLNDPGLAGAIVNYAVANFNTDSLYAIWGGLLRKFNGNDGSVISDVPVTISGLTGDLTVQSIALDPSSGQVYIGLVVDFDFSNVLLATVDLSSGIAKVIGNTTHGIAAMAFDQNGRLFGMADANTDVCPDCLYQIDKHTAQAASVMNFINPWGTAMAFNFDDLMLYCGNNNIFSKVDLSTFTETIVNSNVSLRQIGGNNIGHIIYIGKGKFYVTDQRDGNFGIIDVNGIGVQGLPSLSFPHTQGFLLAGFDAVAVSDNSGHYTITQTGGLPSGSLFPIGTTINTFEIRDPYNNVSNCSFTVTINNSCEPAAFTSLPADITQATDANGCTAVVTYELQTAGTPAPDLSYIFSGATTGNGTGTGSGLAFNKGTTTVTITATNSCSSANCTFNVTVTDDQYPVFGIITNISVNKDAGKCGALINISTPVATDNCSAPVVTGSRNDGLSLTDDYPTGTTVITWAAEDENHNITTAIQNIIVTDNETPVPDVAILPTITGECSASAAAPTATDNCAGTIVGTTLDATSYTEQGTYTITWNFDDGNGNVSTQTQTVIVKDITAPVPDVVTLPAIVGECSVTISAAPSQGGAQPPTQPTGPAPAPASGSAQPALSSSAAAPPASGPAPAPSSGSAPAPSSGSSPGQGSGTPSANAPTATDNCAGSITATTTDPLTYTTQGTYVIHWTYDDGNGNISTQIQTVIVKDTKAPVADNDALPIITAECSVTVTDIPTATDNCAGVISGTTNDPVTYSTQGTHIIHWSFDDGNGNIATQDQSVIIQDVTAPVPDVTTLPTITGECLASVTAPTATDNCAGMITGTTPDPTSYRAQGTYTITWSFDDGNGNTSSQTQRVVVKDLTPPVPTVSVLPIVTGQCSATVNTKPTATDACSGVISAGTTTDPLTYTVQGTYSIHWTYTDNYGNKSYQNQTVIVKDDVAPVPNSASLPTIEGQCSVNITMINSTHCTDNCYCCRIVCHCRTSNCNCRSWSEWIYSVLSYFLGGAFDNNHGCDHDDDVDNVNNMKMQAPTATDNCKGTIIGTTTDPLNYSTQGTYIIHWSFTDGNGNISIQNQTVKIADVEAPVPNVSNLNTVYGTCSAIVTTKPTASDNCKGTITGTTTDPLTYTTQGTFTIHWTYSDGNGNTTTQNQTVIVKDDTKPKLTEPNDITISCGTSTLPAATGNATATDNCTVVSITYTDVVNGNKITRTWKATDAAGNYDTDTQLITIADNTKPVITAPASITVACGTSTAPAITGTATATDNCSTPTVTYSDNSTGYVTTRTWKATDAAGNYSTSTQIITVVDNVKPTITVPNNVTVNCGSSTNPSATGTATGTDACSGVTISYNDASVNNVITRTWKATDAAGNFITAAQTITIVDNIKPVISDVSDITISCGSSTTPAGCNSIATATDNCSTPVVTYSDVVSTNKITRTWQAKDAAGNIATSTQVITIVDNTKPIISDVSDITVNCGASTLPTATGTPTATDACSTPVVIYTDVTSGNKITRTWKATDAAGNYSTSTQTITIGSSFTATVSSVPTNNTYTGGNDNNLYIGYGAQSTTLQMCSLPSAGAPYTYAWSGSYTNKLNSTTSAAPLFTPATFGYYTFSVTVTNKYGCTSVATISICVTDIRVPGSNGKVYVCHAPPGNANNRQTLSVSINAVDAHLTGHSSDRLGSCDQSPCNTTAVNSIVGTALKVTAENGDATVATSEEELKVTVMPNPTTTFFTLKLESKFETPVTMRVMDASGRVVDARSKIGANSTILIGHNYSSGIYYAELIQGNRKKVVQMIKGRG